MTKRSCRTLKGYETMSKITSTEELELMRKSGEMSAKAMKKVLEAVKPGANLLDLEKIATEEIKRLGGESSFKSVPGYYWTTCLTVNDEVVHGIPRNIVLKKGDKLSVDLGALYKGWHTDTAWSVIVDYNNVIASEARQSNQTQIDQIATSPEAPRDDKSRFLAVGEEALWIGIKQAKAGNRVGDISEAIQEVVEGKGYHVVRSLVGHGVGKELHEEPEVPGFGKRGTGPVLQEGMTIAVEVIYTEGTEDVIVEDDRWTISSADGSWGGLFEMSLIVGKEKAEVLTDWRKV